MPSNTAHLSGSQPAAPHSQGFPPHSALSSRIFFPLLVIKLKIEILGDSKKLTKDSWHLFWALAQLLSGVKKVQLWGGGVRAWAVGRSGGNGLRSIGGAGGSELAPDSMKGKS